MAPDMSAVENAANRRRREKGLALVVMLTVIALGAVMLALSAFSANARKAERDNETNRALSEAKDALIGYALRHATLPGALPCPDTTNDGTTNVSGQNCTAYIGQLPWKTLGLGDLRDSAGECLWYALRTASLYRAALPAGSRNSGNALNSDTVGGVTLKDGLGNLVSNQVVAVIFAPGATLPGQDRTIAGTPVCGGNNSATNYLDTGPAPDTINNATGTGDLYVTALASDTFNDRLITITQSELTTALVARVAAEIRGYSGKGLQGYYETNGSKLPCAAAGSDGVEGTGTTGFLPYAALSFDSTTQTWLSNNLWYSKVSAYTVSPACGSTGTVSATLTIGGKTFTLNFP